ncbi:rab-GTPase-TBC domain-containing protein [Exophiala viscosa]|uniref:rab-GTPase-TBC domain-containing protein n=1 Tax=Exophiala viscosa TaxID=2486360 RepID=UPI002193A081|nr:rab-GTPase-TBC domain-containing protein [Exophiala viscosa]
MEQQVVEHSYPEEDQETLFDSNTAIEPENIPLPRSSMISVRLSDVQLQPETEELDASSRTSVRQSTSSSPRSSVSSSRTSASSISMNTVDWEGLEKTEEQEARDDATDESNALLLARLEKENAALAVDPKAGIATSARPRKNTRPPSVQQLKRMVDAPQRQTLRYSMLPAPPMTELEFWAALVQDYTQTAQRLPTLTSNKIRAGVPPPLRGVVWPSIARAHDAVLHSEYQRLSTEPSPYDALIGKDVGRSFPNVDMFREKDGEGQRMLGKVLKAFSLYDEQIGYCQGLGFVVGPLLMHMSESEAFCVLVRLMEHYDLRSCYLPDLSGLHLRIYQFQQLLTRHLPELAAHLEALKIEPLYVSQWFLSFFAVTCPLPMLLRIYDVILSEGATETLMRVALSLMQRNQKKLMAFIEFEDVMQFLLSRSLWDTYAQHADDLVIDFVSFTGLVSQESLQALETDFKLSQNLMAAPSLASSAASFLGRFWAGATHAPSRSANLSLLIPGSSMRKSSSGQSLTSTVNSVETSASEASTAPTDVSDDTSSKSSVIMVDITSTSTSNTNDRDLHHQIEGLLTELSKVQRQHSELALELQREREEREEDRQISRTLLEHLRIQTAEIRELAGDETAEEDAEVDAILEQADQQFCQKSSKRVSIAQSKHQLRDDVSEWKERHEAEVTKCRELTRRLDEREAEHNALKEHLRDARARIQDAHREKQRLERTVSDLRTRNNSVPESPADLYTPVTEFPEVKMPPPQRTGSGLRELKLGKSEQARSSSAGPYSKRSSSLNSQALLATDNHEPVANDALLLELVNAKTAEAVARQELEETKGKLDALRKILTGSTSSPSARASAGDSPTASNASASSPGTKEAPKPTHIASASTGGFFSGWGKRGS